MKILLLISVVLYLIYFWKHPSPIKMKDALQSGVIGFILWVFVRIMIFIVLIQFIFALFTGNL